MRTTLKNLAVASIILFSYSSWSAEPKQLIDAWLSSRFNGCSTSEELADALTLANTMTLNSLSRGDCKNVNLQDPNNKDTRACMKKLNADLQIYMDRSSNNLKNQGCIENPKFKEYLTGDNLKVVKPVYSASVVCKNDDDKGFQFMSADGKAVCTKKVKCPSDFRFGQTVLESGTYFLRCNSGATSQADCNDMGGLTGCEGKEVSAAKINFVGMKSDSIRVQPTVKAAN